MPAKTTRKRPKTPKAPDPATRSLEKLIKAPGPERRPWTLLYPSRDRGRTCIPEKFYLYPRDIEILDAAGAEWIGGSLNLEWLEGYLVEEGIATLADLEGLSMTVTLGAIQRRVSRDGAKVANKASAQVEHEKPKAKNRTLEVILEPFVLKTIEENRDECSFMDRKLSNRKIYSMMLKTGNIPPSREAPNHPDKWIQAIKQIKEDIETKELLS